MKTSHQLLVLGMALSTSAMAADPVDTSQWACKDCPAAQGLSGSVDAGIGNVSDKSAKFGEYSGLYRQGGFFIGDTELRYRGEGATYWNLNSSNLGLDTRSLDAEGGKQGVFKLFFKYEELSHHISDSVRTPFLGNGGASLTLPPGFPAATTGAMPLATTLQQLDVNQDRKRTALGASWIPASNWEYAVKFNHETREATKRTSGAFFVNSAQLVESVDYHTDQVDASASYTGGKLQAKLAYYGSTFRNNNDALSWQNPFTAIAGATAGQRALPPDNQFHQVIASAGYQFTSKTRGSADIAWGRMTQNDGFLASTTNPGLAVPALPASSANARAETLNANIKLTSAITDKLRLSASYAHDNRDNQTPQAAFPSVSTDMFLGAARTNMPFSFTQDKLKLGADYRIAAGTKVAVGLDYDSRKRTFQEVDKTTEDTVWGKVNSKVRDDVDLTVKLAHGERSASGYKAVPLIALPENPLLRKFYLANRTRDTAGVRADIAATEKINIGLGIDSSKDDYSDSSIGLTSGSELGVNGDLSVALTDTTSLHAFAVRQEIKSKQFGSQAFSGPDWSGENKDTIKTVGIGVKHVAIKDKLDIGADFMVTRTSSAIGVSTGASDPAFPNITSSMDSLKLYANYRLKDNLSLLASYWTERYESKNWMLDGVTPGSIPNILAFGEQSPHYHVNVIRLAARYRF